MRNAFLLCAAVWVSLACSTAFAAEAPSARWIWYDAGNPQVEAPAGKVWFRKEFRAGEPSTGAVLIASDGEFTLWVNGEKIGSGEGNKTYRFSLSGIVGRGVNVFAVEVSHKGGPAGLYVDGEIRGQSGRRIPCDSSPEWKATLDAPKSTAWLSSQFDDAAWKLAKDLGPHETSPWKALSFAAGELDRFQVPPDFEIKRLADAKLAGSVVAMTWGNRGRLIVSRERGPIVVLSDENSDGVYDKAVEYSTEVTNCQGLCMVADDLYAVGNGPQQTGLYRLPDRNHDDKADSVELVLKHRGGMGEHGPHDVIYGPDGWLYHNIGNHAGVPNAPEANTPCRRYEEGYLLNPKYEDANGHAAGIKAPGGTIWRFTPDGKKWWLETNGFRNEYDFAFNSQGDMFSFDSDMEWDVNLPWYRPVRVNHCIPGAEFGWRSGSAKWPAGYFDSLPGTVDVGRGSPTGVVFYEHTQFPEKYRGAMLNCDWSMGRIIVAFLKPDGVTYTGTTENLVTGNPLNVSDIEIDRDGSVVFCTGGRNTEGGVYRVSYTKAAAQKPAVETLADVLAMPQMQSAWAREAAAAVKAKLGDQWVPGLTARLKEGTPAEKIRVLTLLAQLGPRPDIKLLSEAASDPNASVRAFATWQLGEHSDPEIVPLLSRLLTDPDKTVRRRACEAFVRSGLPAPVDPLLTLLADEDRWLRYAARLTLERVPVQQWQQKVLDSISPDVVLTGLLALHRQEPQPLSKQSALQHLAQLSSRIDPNSRQRLDWLRMLELALLREGSNDAALGSVSSLNAALAAPGIETNESELATALRMESARLAAFLQAGGSAEHLVNAMEHSPTQALQIHYFLCGSFLEQGWTPALNERVINWYEQTRTWEGGNSFQGYLRNFFGGHLDHISPQQMRQVFADWRKHPFAMQTIIGKAQPQQVQDYDATVQKLLAEIESDPAGTHHGLIGLTIDALGKSSTPQSQAVLQKLFDNNADRRDQLARSLAKHPIPQNVPYLVRSLRSRDGTTLQVCLQALASSDYRSDKPDEVRLVILAGLRLGPKAGPIALKLLKKWTGNAPASPGDFKTSIAHYQQWFQEKYPDSVPATLPKDDAEKTGYTFKQLVDFLDRNPAGQKGNVSRGRQVFAKANCIKCHRFVKEGEGVGPDLTTVRRRFQRKEIVESVIYPSQVISDQYAAVTVQTVAGLVHTGMPLPNPGSENLLLLLPDATRLEIPKKEIEEKVVAKVSVMPEGLLKGLSLADIADLFAFLETSKNNAEPAGGGTVGRK